MIYYMKEYSILVAIKISILSFDILKYVFMSIKNTFTKTLKIIIVAIQ